MDNKKRLAGIKEKVDLLEGLHKTCQLTALGLDIPVLNESRYLARALADALAQPLDSQACTDAVSRAELAVLSGINDAVDTLLTFVKTALRDIEKRYPNFEIALSSYGDEYIDTLKAIQKIDTSVVYSRQERTERYEIYKQLAIEKTHLQTVANFSLKLLEIEAIAKLDDKSVKATAWHVEQMHQALLQDSQGESDARFDVEYQAKYETKSGKGECIGAEALLRFRLGTVNIPPSEFIRFAENNQFIIPIGQHVLNEALKTLSKYPEIPSIAVNVSAFELLDPNYASNVIEKIKKSGIDPSRIEFEITETAALRDTESESHLQKLAEFGARVAIDDFGTGETRFDYLAKIPLGVIKIDMSIVRKFEKAPNEYRKLIKAITAAGKACDLDVIAEGVENELVMRELQSMGITQFQGWHFGKPLTETAFVDSHKSNFVIV